MMRWLPAALVLAVLLTPAPALAGVSVGNGWETVGYYTNPQFGSGAITTFDRPRSFGLGCSSNVRYDISATGLVASFNQETGIGGLNYPFGVTWTPTYGPISQPSTSTVTGYGYIASLSLWETTRPIARDPALDWRMIHYAQSMGVLPVVGGVAVGQGFGAARFGNNYSAFTWSRNGATTSFEKYREENGKSSISSIVMCAAIYESGAWKHRVRIKDVIKLRDEGEVPRYSYTTSGPGYFPTVVHTVSQPIYYQQVKYPTLTGPADLGDSSTFTTMTVSVYGEAVILETRNFDSAKMLYDSMASDIAVPEVLEPVEGVDDLYSDETTIPPLPGYAKTFYEKHVKPVLDEMTTMFAGWLWPLEEFAKL